MRRKGFEKYLMYEELANIWARASDKSVVVVYQHLQNDARNAAGDVDRRLRDLKTHLGPCDAWAVQWSDLAFLVAVRDQQLTHRTRETVLDHAVRYGFAFSEIAA